ncbi:methionine synthase reductase [Anastrepha obliqua]|uniref:methionine synthase reductase n=1 Tax=Anastrepha obliqua TaxID=95512 RepID=UPI00240A8640|nr:methionine synthase reductase [Anastrepha obliqua]
MVCPTDFDKLDIKAYILNKYVPAKVSEPMYIISSADDLDELKSTKHAQLQCSDLIWPFSRPGALPAEVPIKEVQILTEQNDEIKEKCIMELIMEMQADSNYYQPGDTIGILPYNNSRDVQSLLQHMDLTNKSNSTFELQISPKCTKKTAKLPPYIPTHCTPFKLLRDCLNLHAIPKKQFLNSLANCCGNTDEREFLSCLSSKEGSPYYNELILQRGLTLLELMELCPSCKPTLEVLIEHLPRLLPRPYSIANNVISQEIKIIFSILTEKPGVTTNMLKSLGMPFLKAKKPVELPKVIAYARHSSEFRFTSQEASENNHILIGVGTALAPFLGFLEKKEQLLTDGAYTSLGDTWLFAGAATESSILHRENVLAFYSTGVLQRYFECLSRVPSAKYHYVQEQILANATELIEFLLQENTVLYVCADGGSVSKSIEKAIVECFAQVQQITLEEALETIKTFKRNGKFREDLWL